MPDLSRTVRWLEFKPDLLGNLAEERPFYFKLNGSMSKAQLLELDTALEERLALPELPADPTPEQVAERREAERAAVALKYGRALEPYVQLGEEPLTADGKRVATLGEYFDLVTRIHVGLELLFEPYRALLEVNSLGVRGGFFSGRLSGGFTSTAARGSGKGRSQTAGR